MLVNMRKNSLNIVIINLDNRQNNQGLSFFLKNLFKNVLFKSKLKLRTSLNSRTSKKGTHLGTIWLNNV